MLNLMLTGAFFCYGVFTLQRKGFLLDKLPKLWKKLPKALHEPLFACGVCVTSIWGIVFIVSQYFIDRFAPVENRLLINLPFYIIAMCGVCALVDRAVKSFEYNYKYNSIPPMSDYSYLSNYQFRDNLITSFLDDVVVRQVTIIEIGGMTEFLKKYDRYYSVDKQDGKDAMYLTPSPDFILIKGLMFEGNFDHLLNILSAARGFVIEGSLGGESGKQLNWIMDRFHPVIKIPYTLNDLNTAQPPHCGDVHNRVVLVKPLSFTI